MAYKIKKYQIWRSGKETFKIPIKSETKTKIKYKIPKIKKKMTLQEAENLYRYEEEHGIINTPSTPLYENLNDYVSMLRAEDIEIEDK